MQLLSLTIKNFRSIEIETFIVKKISDNSYTFTLIGINESGKSSFLKAISLIDNDDEKIVFPKDYFEESEPISIFLDYKLEPLDEKRLKAILIEKGFDRDIVSRVKVERINIYVTFDPDENATKKNFDKVVFRDKIFKDYVLQEDKPVKKDRSETQEYQEDFDLEKYFETYFPQYFWKISHRIIFWKSDSKHLINDQIDLNVFAADPENTSIPLLNCFELAGVGQDDIAKQVTRIKTDSAEISNLQDKLSDKVTAHIKKIWPSNAVKIKFQINNSFLSFLIEDEKVRYKSKTTEQRSDGFKQFISFLLTISAESATNQLTNSILLLDELETHLHPQAQEYLKDELIKITKNEDNNIVFFATHSNYMIDKYHIERCFRVLKHSNRKTGLEKIELGETSYSEVNYEVFGILSSDYHNELYGYLEDVYKSKIDSLPKILQWQNKKSGATEDVSLATYIRHSIHHPENTLNVKFTLEQLQESINVLRNLKYGKK